MKVNHTIFQQKYYEIDPPIEEEDYRCPWCQQVAHVVIKDSKCSSWICISPGCESSQIKGKVVSNSGRALSYQKFCETEKIGNKFWNVSFESIYDHHKAKKDYLEKFANKPDGLILMQGTPGLGKTYLSLALVELYTRQSADFIFIGGSELRDRFLSFTRGQGHFNFKNRCKETPLLIIDDFGTLTPTPGYMDFVWDILSERDKWNNRGTVITTNLRDDQLSECFGEALTDRLRRGQLFYFEGESLR